ncbi:MAG: 30S ribosomal protein S15 [Candidatus Paceibacterota bacterium]
MLNSDSKEQIISKFQIHQEDSGSSPVQIALITERILYLTEHLKENRKDFHTRKGLIHLVSQRKKLLAYLKRTDLNLFEKTVKELGLRA